MPIVSITVNCSGKFVKTFNYWRITMTNNNYAIYTGLCTNNDVDYIYTYTSQDGIERIVGMDTMYCGTHGVNASIGSSWRYCVKGEDEDNYGGTIAECWIDDIEYTGDIFKPERYKYVTKGMITPHDIPNIFTYKKYTGVVVQDDETDSYTGYVNNCGKDVVTFKSKTIEDAYKAFQDSVDDYLEWCEELQQTPN